MGRRSVIDRLAEASGHRVATIALRASARFRGCRPVLVTGAARSGTTWLGEVIAEALNRPMLFEPDHPRYGIGYAERPRIGLDAATGVLYRRVLSGRVVPLGSVRHAGRLWRSPDVVIKSIHAVPHLPELLGETSELAAVLTVRHPCAVVASRLRHTGFAPKQADAVVTRELLAVAPELADARDRARTPAERHALRWAVDHLAVQRAASPTWLGVAHEDLVDDRSDALGSVLDVLVGARRSEAPRRDRPSETTWSGCTGPPRAGADAWREELEPAQVRGILDVTRAVGIEWYDDDPRPIAPIPGVAPA